MIKAVNGIYVTEGVSFPRSGSQWLASMLMRYFESRFQYCEKYLRPDLRIGVDVNTTYEKNHDFDLGSAIRDDRQYLIQVREFEAACISYYRLEHLQFRTKATLLKDKPYVDTTTPHYIEFREVAKDYYDRFIAKWVFAHVPNSHLVIYDKLLADTPSELARIVQFLSDDNVDMAKLAEVVQPPTETQP